MQRMEVKIIETGEIVEVEAGYAMRLVEQGVATIDLSDADPDQPERHYTVNELSALIETGGYVHLDGHTLVFANPITAAGND